MLLSKGVFNLFILSVETTLNSATISCTWVPGKVGDLTLTPVKRHQYPYPLRLEFRSNAPTPEARKMKISKVSRKKKCI